MHTMYLTEHATFLGEYAADSFSIELNDSSHNLTLSRERRSISSSQKQKDRNTELFQQVYRTVDSRER